MAFVWRDELRTGISEIDDQHRELITRINTLLDAMSRPAENREIGSYLSFLAEYTASHFAAEERAMTVASYPGLEAHRKEHDEFRKQVDDLCRQYRQLGGNLSVALRTVSSSGEWLVEHIMKTDKQMAAFLIRAQGR